MAIEPVTREERFLAAAGGRSVTPPMPITRKEQLLQGIIDAVKSGGATPDVIEGAVNDYLNANPVQPGATTEQAAQIEQNKTDIADLQTEIEDKQPKGDYVKTVNGNKPDATGNVVVATGGNGSGQNVPQVEPAEDDIPKVFITGVKPTTKDDVLAEMQYISKTDRFHAYLTIKCQGTSSMSYPKKNFTVKLYSDEARETKLKRDFKDWNHPGNKFVLKANYIDHSHARNIVSARLWGEVVASRPDYDSLPVEMRNAPNNGAVDGFPVKVYYNGTYEGIYTWNIGKDDWMWGMDEDNPNHILLCAETNTDGTFRATPCNFRALWSGVDEQDWSVEVGTNSTALKNSLNNLIQFVMDNDGAAFKTGIGRYLDIQSAIDYYIFQYEVCGLDGLAKNMLLATYDGMLWRCGAYDLDSTFGLWWNGTKFVSATYACPEDYQEEFSLLWERIEANYLTELKARQAELRKTVLSYSNMVVHFERFMDTIGLDLYAEDLSVYSAIPCGATNNIKQIRNFIRDRQAYVDAEFAAMVEVVPAISISLSASTLTIDSKAPVTLTATVEPSDTTDTVLWESTNMAVATVEGGVVTPITNGSTTIRAICGNVSAECAVTVQYAEIPCTSISLSASELTFDGQGSQTLTATPVPSDTTDGLTWESSAPEIATVEGGVVSAVDNGSAVITVRCGEQSADCAVTVSGIVPNILRNVAWVSGYASTTTGEIIASNLDVTSDMFDISDYRGRAMSVKFGGKPTTTSQRISLYDEQGQYLSYVASAGDTGIAITTVPDSAAYARISMLKAAASVEIIAFTTEDIGWGNLEATSGSAYDYATGAVSALAYCTLRDVPVTAGAEYLLSNVFGYVRFDAERRFISGVSGNGAPYLMAAAADNAAYLGVNYSASNAHNVQRIVSTTVIGSASDIVVS